MNGNLLKKAVLLILCISVLGCSFLPSYPVAIAEDAETEIATDGAVYYNRTYDEEGMALADSIATPHEKKNKIEVKTEETGNKYVNMRMADEVTSDCHFDTHITCDSSKIVLEISFSYEDEINEITFYYRDKDKKDNQFAQIIGNDLYVGDKKVAAIKRKKWTNLALALDLSKSTCAVYVNGKLKSSKVTYGGYDAGTIMFTRIHLKTTPGTDISFDNYRIYEGDVPRDLKGELPDFSTVQTEDTPKGEYYPIPEKAPISEAFANGMALMINKSNAYAKNEIKKIDENNELVVPTIVNDRTLVPVRFISENFGGDVAWDGNTKTVTIKFTDKEISLKIGSKEMFINGKKTTLDVAAQTIYDRTMLPLRAISESLDKNVFWDNRGLILITEKDRVIDAKTDSYIVDSMITTIKEGKTDMLYNRSSKFTQWVIDDAIDTALVKFTESQSSSYAGWGSHEKRTTKAMYYLTLAEYLGTNPVSSRTGEKGKDRVLEHIRALIKGGNEPFCCTGPYLSHN